MSGVLLCMAEIDIESADARHTQESNSRISLKQSRIPLRMIFEAFEVDITRGAT